MWGDEEQPPSAWEEVIKWMEAGYAWHCVVKG